jgi:hypothetical protein
MWRVFSLLAALSHEECIALMMSSEANFVGAFVHTWANVDVISAGLWPASDAGIG